jgi:hypothetical protein
MKDPHSHLLKIIFGPFINSSKLDISKKKPERLIKNNYLIIKYLKKYLMNLRIDLCLFIDT